MIKNREEATIQRFAERIYAAFMILKFNFPGVSKWKIEHTAPLPENRHLKKAQIVNNFARIVQFISLRKIVNLSRNLINIIIHQIYFAVLYAGS